MIFSWLILISDRAYLTGLLTKLEEETKINQYMLKDKLPKEVNIRRKTVADLQRVVNEPAMGQADLEQIKDKVSSQICSLKVKHRNVIL